ncbi:UNVERIFIED_ORG: hypothetical protein J2X79_001472 [Arthrobacter globiformis]|nr:hypothetical protein [Arthrobacter globiformis]
MAPRHCPATACNVSTAAKWPPWVASKLHLMVGLARCPPKEDQTLMGIAHVELLDHRLLLRARWFQFMRQSSSPPRRRMKGRQRRSLAKPSELPVCVTAAVMPSSTIGRAMTSPFLVHRLGQLVRAPVDPCYSACPTHFYCRRIAGRPDALFELGPSPDQASVGKHLEIRNLSGPQSDTVATRPFGDKKTNHSRPNRWSDVLSLTVTLFTALSTGQSTGLSTAACLSRGLTRTVGEEPHTRSDSGNAPVAQLHASFS